MRPSVVDSLPAMIELSHPWPAGETVGFVPTMGYLHAGHLSLAQRARSECDRVVVSVFVNPTQFGPNEDLSRYPRDLDHDLDLLETVGVDHVFFPTPEMMYPTGYCTRIVVDDLSATLCGRSRPTHFQGVATVVGKLMHIVNPQFMYMGEKDYQQIVVLERMIADLNFPARIVRCPLIREADGLAMSSRNMYLSPEERQRALCLSEALRLGCKAHRQGETDPTAVIAAMRTHIEQRGGRVDYVEAVDPITLGPALHIDDDTRLLLAVYIGNTRLIDNCRAGN